MDPKFWFLFPQKGSCTVIIGDAKEKVAKSKKSDLLIIL